MDLSLEYPQWLRMLSIIRSLVRVMKILQFFQEGLVLTPCLVNGFRF
jgi:hypothetical protein